MHIFQFVCEDFLGASIKSLVQAENNNIHCSVAILAEMKLIFFGGAHKVLQWMTVLMTHQCLRYCWAVLAECHSFLFLNLSLTEWARSAQEAGQRTQLGQVTQNVLEHHAQWYNYERGGEHFHSNCCWRTGEYWFANRIQWLLYNFLGCLFGFFPLQVFSLESLRFSFPNPILLRKMGRSGKNSP